MGERKRRVNIELYKKRVIEIELGVILEERILPINWWAFVGRWVLLDFRDVLAHYEKTFRKY